MIAINTIFVWQPCRPWPVSVPLSELGEVLVSPWLSLALVPLPVPPRHGTSSVGVLLWPLTGTVPEDKLLQHPWQSHVLWGRKSCWCLPSWAKALKCMSSKQTAHPAQQAAVQGPGRVSAPLPLLQACCLSSLSVTRGPLFSGGTLNHPRIFALQVSSMTSKCFGFVKPQLTSVPGGTM